MLDPRDVLRYHVTGAIERGEKLPIVAIEAEPEVTKVNDLTLMVAWEEDRLSPEGTIQLFQRLVDSGVAWQLQGAYGRQAAAMLDAGLISAPEHIEG